MPKHELFVSAPGSGKTFACIELFREEILRSPSGIDSQSYFVLPNREHAGRIQHLLLKRDMAGLFNAHILTFHELTQKLLSGLTPPRPTQTLRSHLVNLIFQDPSVEWSYFDSVKDLSGFQELVVETIQEFKSSLLSIEEFEKRAQPLLKDLVFRSKFRDFSILVKRYDAALKEMGLADEDDVIRELLPALEPPSGINLIVMDGFYHFTRAQRAIISYLAPHTQKIVVSLTIPKNTASRKSVFAYGEATRQFLTSLGFSRSDKAEGPNHRAQDSALRHLEENVFLDTPAVYEGITQSIQLIEADHVHDEAAMIAHAIRECHRDRNVHFSDIAVILRSVGPYQKRLKAAFKDYEIPYFIHERGKMIENSALRFVYTFLSLFSQDWQSASLLSLLGANFLKLPLDPKELVEFERRMLRSRLEPKPEAWSAWFKSQENLSTVERRFERLMDARRILLDAKTAPEFRLRLDRELKDMGWELSLGESDQAAYRAFQDLCKQWEMYGAHAAQMPEHLRRGIELGLYSEKPSGKNRIQVYDTVMALPKEYKIVFLAGLLEKQFPKEINEDAIFKDDERRQLNAQDWILEERLPRTGGERFFFYMALTRAREQLYLSYPLKDIEGKPHTTSFFVEEVLKCFKENTLTISTSRDWKESVDWVAAKEAEKGVSRKIFEVSPIDAGREKDVLGLANVWLANKRFIDILSAGQSSNQAQFLDPRIAPLFAQGNSIFSATRLESYLTCAFKYHADYTLRLQEPLENRERIEMGTVIHEVLENYLKAGDRSNELVAQLLDKAFAKSSLMDEPGYRRDMYRERIAQIIDRFISTEAERLKARDFEPKHYELAFGRRPGADPSSLDFLSWGDIRIEGKIDRVDVSEMKKEALITDYKLSKKPLWEKLDKGLEVQLPIYIMAVQELMGLTVVGAELRFLEEDADMTAGLYLDSARDALGLGPKKRAFSSEAWEDILENTKSNVALAVKRLRSGDIRIRSKSCQFCPYDSVCRFETWRLIYDEVDGG